MVFPGLKKYAESNVVDDMLGEIHVVKGGPECF